MNLRYSYLQFSNRILCEKYLLDLYNDKMKGMPVFLNKTQIKMHQMHFLISFKAFGSLSFRMSFIPVKRLFFNNLCFIALLFWVLGSKARGDIHTLRHCCSKGQWGKGYIHFPCHLPPCYLVRTKVAGMYSLLT